MENSQEQRKDRIISDTGIHHPHACTHHKSGGWGPSPNLLPLQIGPCPWQSVKEKIINSFFIIRKLSKN